MFLMAWRNFTTWTLGKYATLLGRMETEHTTSGVIHRFTHKRVFEIADSKRDCVSESP